MKVVGGKLYFAPVCVLLAMLAVWDHAHSAPSRTPTHQVRHGQKQAPVHPVQWVVLGRPGKSNVRIGNIVGWCPDRELASRPHIVGVRQVDRARSVSLTAYLAQKNQNSSPCAGVETPVEYVVHIRHGLRGRPLYDGSQTPPLQRWPR